MCLLSVIFLAFPISQRLLFLALLLNRSQSSQSQDLILPTLWCTPYSWSSWGPSSEHKSPWMPLLPWWCPLCAHLSFALCPPVSEDARRVQRTPVPRKILFSILWPEELSWELFLCISFCSSGRPERWSQDIRNSGKKIKTANSLLYGHSLSIDFLTLPTFSYLLFRILQDSPYISCLGFLVGERYDTRCSLRHNQKRTL